jgi:hypothetical protein
VMPCPRPLPQTCIPHRTCLSLFEYLESLPVQVHPSAYPTAYLFYPHLYPSQDLLEAGSPADARGALSVMTTHWPDIWSAVLTNCQVSGWGSWGCVPLRSADHVKYYNSNTGTRCGSHSRV